MSAPAPARPAALAVRRTAGSRRSRRMPLAVYLWSQVVLLCWWAIDFPGQLSRDSVHYVHHVTLGPWVADHSVLYDFGILCSLKLVGGIWLVTLTQTVLYAVILALLASRVRDLNVRSGLAALPAVVIVLVPTFGSFVAMLWKDVPFAAANLLLTATLLKVVADRRRGTAGMSVRTVAALALEMTGIVLFRNNGFVVVVLATIVLVLVLRGDRLKAATAGGAAVAVLALCAGVIYPLFGIRAADSDEAYGVFYGDIALVYSRAPRDFTRADLAVMRTAAPLAQWRSSSDCLTSDPLFAGGRFDTAAASAHRHRLAGVWFDVLRRDPAALIGGHLCRASIAWKVAPTAHQSVLPARTPGGLYGLTKGWPPSLISKLKPDPVSWKLYHVATDARRIIHRDAVMRTIFSRAAGWTYLAYLAVIVAVLRNRWCLLLLAAMPILVNQLTVMIANPAQLYRYTAVQLFLGFLLLPLVAANWQTHDRDGGGCGAAPTVSRAGAP